MSRQRQTKDLISWKDTKKEKCGQIGEPNHFSLTIKNNGNIIYKI
jgi:hypothetical protein